MFKVDRLWIYIDTSVLVGCFDGEFAVWSNGLVRDFRVGRLVPVTAEVVALVSGNFQHIVRLEKLRLCNAVNAGWGHKALSILSPREATT